MNHSVQAISVEEGKSLIQSYLCMEASISSDGSPTSYLLAEALRSALYSKWSVDRRPIYITGLLYAAARIMLPWHRQFEQSGMNCHEQLRSLLEELEIIGDITSLPGGYLLPAPLRAVPLSEVNKMLLLGGLPISSLSQEIRMVVRYESAIRHMSSTSEKLLNHAGIPIISEEEWLRVPDNPLKDWTHNILEQTAITAIDAVSPELYVPYLADPKSPHYYRWFQPSKKLSNGRYLARTQMRRGSRAFFIAHLEQGQLCGMGKPDVGNGDIRRLMYGIDMMMNKPTRIKTQIDRHNRTFKLQSDVPQAEQRLLIALGRELPKPHESYYPRLWEVPSTFAPRVLKAFQNLGIVVD